MKRIPSHYFWLAIAVAGLGFTASSFFLVAWFKLQPCPLCIAQRTLFFLMGLAALAAFFSHRMLARFMTGVLTLLSALSGAAVAGYQVWLQHQPASMFTCGADTNFLENFVYWLGDHVPYVFDAPGVCQDTSFKILGQTLAMWALIAFSACAVLALWAMLRKGPKV